MSTPLTFHVSSCTHKAPATYFARGLIKELVRPGTTFLTNTVFEAIAFLKTSQAGAIPDSSCISCRGPTVTNQDAPIRHDVDKRPRTHRVTDAYSIRRAVARCGSLRPIPQRRRSSTSSTLADPPTSRCSRGLGDDTRDLRSAAFNGAVKEEIHPGRQLRGQELRDAILNRATSFLSTARGTCRWASTSSPSSTGPQGPASRAAGCDASIMPSITGGNTNAPPS